MNFSDLNLGNSMLKVLNDLGYTTPTTIQQRVFSVVMSGADVCGIAQTGTGKTLAYLLPLIRMWKYTKTKDPQILILVPTRELVMQVVETIKKLTVYNTMAVEGVYGGTNINTQKIALEAGADIIVATPGRLYDLAMAGAFKLKTIKKLVVDEVDEMLNLGFRPQLKNILELLPQRRQNLLFSATLIPEVEQLLDEYFNEPVKIEAAPAGTPIAGIVQQVYEVPNFNTKVNLLKLLLANHQEMNKVLVFAATRKLADDLFGQLDTLFPDAAGVIHSNKDQNYRFNTVRQFKKGNYRFIVATDIVARGIDVAGVSHVINFDLPIVPEHYIHRIGRTGRADARGIAISFITPRDAEALDAIETLMNHTVERLPLPDDLEISTVLTDDEIPKVIVKEVQIKVAKREGAGPSFHEKSAKNQKRNTKVSRRDQMKKKYGKPITRRGKR